MRKDSASIYLVGLLISIATFCACGGSEEGGNNGGPVELRMATFNTGLAPGLVEYVDERAPLIAQELATQNVDILCLQGLMSPAYSDMVEQATQANFSQLVKRPPEPDRGSGEPACTSEEVAPLQSCTNSNCASSNNLVECVVSTCNAEMQTLTPTCFQCLANSIAAGSVEDIIQTCVTASGSPYMSDGAFGTLLLTKGTLIEQSSRLFPSTLNRRAVLYAQAEFPDVGELHVFCTHLTSYLPDIPYTGTFDSWEAEQAAQIDQLLSYIDEKAGSDGRVILLGSINAGPAAAGGIVEVVPENFAKLTTAGYRTPYLELIEPPCTFCEDNALAVFGSGGGSSITDHVLFKNIEAGATADRIFTEPVSYDAGGMTVSTPYSDHYGVSVTVQFE